MKTVIKKLNAFRVFLPALIVAVCFAGCSERINTITDIDLYSDMQAGGDKIEVCFENGTRYGFEFTVEDKNDIEDIVNTVITTPLINSGKQPAAPGDNTYFTVYQGKKAYIIHLSGVISNGNRYTFSTDGLRNKINAIAEANGAFETE